MFTNGNEDEECEDAQRTTKRRNIIKKVKKYLKIDASELKGINKTEENKTAISFDATVLFFYL